MAGTVTISHPHGNPNSNNAARAFFDARLLRVFEQGVTNGGLVSNVFTKLAGGSNGRLPDCQTLPKNRIRQHLLWEGLSRIGKKLRATGPTTDVSWYDILFCGHDWQVSKGIEEYPGAVYAYEDGACRTFLAAKRTSATTIYELPAGYYAGVANELNTVRESGLGAWHDVKGEPPWKVRRKDSELLLADVVVVPSKWAAASLRFSSTTWKQNIIEIPYGTPSGEVSARTTPPAGPFTVLFAGKVGARKGVPYLLDAWSQLGLKNARLWLAGQMALDESLTTRHTGSFEHFGAVPRSKLMELMKAADLLVFPSIAEGFGLVIGEAMAVGTPVLTTTNTGGPELITEGQEGWCIPAHDVEALVDRIGWAYSHRDVLFEMGRVARQKAEQWTWAHYRRSLIEKLTPFLPVSTE